MSAGHDHPHAGPGTHLGTGLRPDADRKRLLVALGLLAGLMAVEVVVGLLVDSLALLADAGHMLADAGALALALLAIRLAAIPPRGDMTYGLKRAEILSAQANGLTLLVLGSLIVYEGIRRLIEPPQPGGLAMVIVACVGIVVNLLATWQLSKANRESLNIEGAYLHVMTDLLAFVGTAIAGVVILASGFDRADGIAALGIAASMLWAAARLLRESTRVFLEAAPRGIEVERVGEAMAEYPGVTQVHDLHVWEITSGMTALSAHILVRPGDDCHGIRRQLELLLEQRFGIDHTTLQVDHEHEGMLLTIDPARAAGGEAPRAGSEG
ncbi:MAG TPA: cation diffusion facilitator family transporter [Gaiellaceae bacterium]